MASNLKRLASQRSDVFDAITGQPVEPEEQDRRKKMMAFNGYDGAADGHISERTAMQQNLNMEEQIKLIHERFAEKR